MTGINNKKKVVFFLSVFIMLIFFHFFGWLDFVRRGLRTVVVPVSSFLHKSGNQIKNAYSYFSGNDEFFKNYSQCLSESQSKKFLESKVLILENEKIELEKQLNFKEKKSIQSVGAYVIGKGIENAEKILIINAGIEKGIKVNQPVITGDGILIGKIIKVDAEISSVRLINDNQSKIAAVALNKDGSLGVVEGGYGLSVHMNFIPRNETILNGDKIVTSGMENEIPKGLLIGAIAAVKNELYQPFQQAIIVPSADLSKIYLVSVLLTN
ncbi:MAG: rod shape-determining protein MreC [Patescibacteria group bacterium]|nr:rod shape-determining protein MreC [Patescibacteria group bacterium]